MPNATVSSVIHLSNGDIIDYNQQLSNYVVQVLLNASPFRATLHQRVTLRRLHEAPADVHKVVYDGKLHGKVEGDNKVYHFMQDVKQRGLLEALLHVEALESAGHYKTGTAMAAFKQFWSVARGISG